VREILKKILFFVLITFAVVSNFSSSMPAEAGITVFGDDRDLAILSQAIPQGFFLSYVELITHNLIESTELIDLLGLKNGAFITAQSLTQGLELLFKKNKFSMVKLRLENDMVGKKLCVECIGIWTLRSIVIHGVLVGKELYKRHYVLEPGDNFDITKHHHSLERLHEALRKEGYFDARIEPVITYDDQTKSVDVALYIKRGTAFSIGAIHVACKNATLSLDDEPLHKRVQVLLRSGLTGMRYNWQSINKTTHHIKQYLTKKGFNDVKIELEEVVDTNRRRIDLSFSLDTGDKREFLFFGNCFFSREQLQEIIASFGPTISIVPPSMIEQELVRAYHDKGFWEISIQIKDEQSTCFFLINEGNRAVIEGCELKGVDTSRLTEATKFFKRLSKPIDFDANYVCQATEALLNWYNDVGYCSAQILRQEFVTIGENRHKLVLTLDEGPCSFLTGLEIEDYPDLKKEPSFALWLHELKMQGKMPLDIPRIQEQKKWLLDYFHQRGYMQAAVQYELRGNPESLMLVWHIKPGMVSYFGKTVLQNLGSFPYAYVMRELRYNQGELWDPKKLHETLVALRGLDVFESVYVMPDHMQIGQEIPVIIKFCKQDPFELRIRAGAGLQQVGKNFPLGRGVTYNLGTTFFCKNPFNRADQLLFDADFYRTHQSIQGEYRYPWLFNKPVRGLIRGYSVHYDQPGFVGSREDLYHIQRQGCVVGATAFNRGVEFTGITGIEWLQTTVAPEQARIALIIGEAIDFDPLLFAAKIPYFLFEPSLIVDYVDNRLCPRCGFFTLFSCKGMLPLNTIFAHAYFVRLQAEHAWFMPLHPRLVFGMRLRLGYIFHAKFDHIMPSERFYLGGANSVRSYNTDLCPPLKIFSDEYGVCQIAPRGGTTMMNGNLEARFSVTRTFECAVFQDVGFLDGSPQRWFNRDFWVAGTGFGLRYNTPLGPLRFDIAWKWRTNRLVESSYAWFLRLGQAF